MSFLRLTFIAITFSVFSFVQAQSKKDPVLLGTINSFEERITQKIKATALNKGGKLVLKSKVSQSENIELDIQFKEVSKKGFNIVGSVKDISNSTFFIKMHDGDVSGNIILKETNAAYEYYSKSGQVFITEKDINEVICILPPQVVPNKSDKKSQTSNKVAAATNNLQSKSGGEACVYLDYDGHYVPAGSRWNNGNPINAAHSGFSDAKIQESWEIVAEDFRPFNVNITTNRAVFDSYAPNRRMWCVITPTNTAAPGAGGVAYLNSFGYIKNEVCWVFNPGAKSSGETASHEIGHTLGLGHDGRTNPSEGYFAGHGDWAPITGSSFYDNVTQWSKGEYNNANNRQDDLATMSNFIRYRNDDHGNAFGNSTYININSSGNISQQYGVIETRGDQDMFAFDYGTGNVYLDINTVGRHGNLDTKVKLYEGSSGNLIGTFNGNDLNTRLEAYLGAGRYYIGIEGTGAGNPATNGYSDYASLGSFWISGTIPPGSGGGNSVATVYQHCTYGGNAVGLSEGSYTRSQLIAAGTNDDYISSLKVQSGYQVTLYFHDNFTGNSIVKTGDTNCLVEDGFNDEVTSLRVSKTTQSTSAQTIEAENYTSMSGIQKENCTEGGQNVGYIDTGDWMAYANVNFPSSGSYRIEYRVASAVGGGTLSSDLNAGTTNLGQVNIPNTGGWQNWTTVSHTVNVNAGTHAFGLYASSGGWNINWIKITSVSSSKSTNTILANKTETSQALKRPTTTLPFPNPFKNSIRFNFEEKNAKITVFNTLGQTMLSSKTIEPGKPVDLSNLQNGLYLISIEKDGIIETVRVIKE